MLYPERLPAPESLPDRLLGAAGFALQRALRRRLRGGTALEAGLRAQVDGLRGQPLPPRLAPLRYRLRREGLQRALVLEACALYCAALPAEEPLPGGEVLCAALWLARGGVAELACGAARSRAVELAAFVRALNDPPVHVLAVNERAARELAAALRPGLAALGVEVGLVAGGMDEAARRAAHAAPLVCASHREVGLDYLRDRVLFGGAPGALRNRLERLSGGGGARRAPLLAGLRSALVMDADAVMLDDARAPLMIAREADQSRERLMYEQAMELARALQAERDFHFEDGELRLTEAAAVLLDRLVTPLGGVWAARERREELVGLALHALHVMQRDTDYRVERDAVLLPERPREEAESAAERDAVLLMLLEVKEGCRTSQRREVVARLSLPSFLARYLHIGGVCADARGVEGELWRLYRLPTAAAGRRAATPAPRATVLAARAAKHAALVERAHAAGAQALLIAVRTPAEAQAIEAALAASGIPVATARGRGDELERRALAALEQPGGVALVLYPALPPARAPGAPPLQLVIAELHDSRRHVGALAAAAGAWSVELVLALDEEVVQAALGAPLAAVCGNWTGEHGVLPPRLASLAARAAQRGVERAQAALRQELAMREQYLHDLLAFSGEGH